MAGRGKLGLIAGGGALPRVVAERAQAAGREVFVIRLRGFAGPDLADLPGDVAGLAELGRCFSLLARAGCEAVCFVGQVSRPDFSALKPDLRGLAALPGAVAAARRGDDALLRYVLDQFAREGFRIEGAHEAGEGAGLVLAAGPLGRRAPAPEHAADLAEALRIARALGGLDIGQGAVVARGVVLAVEAQEGTDAMLRRCADLPTHLRGGEGARVGVLAKAPKPSQERRVDLPTLGVLTVELAAAAGLAGVAAEAGGTLLLDQAAIAAAADRLGLFVVGVEAPGA